MRRKVIAANWKMYKTIVEAVAFVDALEGLLMPVDAVQMIICPPALVIPYMRLDSRVALMKINIGAQNGHWEQEGAFTGEISMEMIYKAGCTHVIVGHSERRGWMGETDDMVNKKVKEALRVGLIPIVCVGETAKERDENRTEEIVGRQLRIALQGIDLPNPEGIIIAYEPVWAIGSGTPALPDDAGYVHRFIRMILAGVKSETWADSVQILYGGSVKPDNISDFLHIEGIDGALIGGASLQPDSFMAMVRKAAEGRN